MRWHLHRWRQRAVVITTWPLLWGLTEERCTRCGKLRLPRRRHYA